MAKLPLNPQQKVFLDHYLKTGKIKESAVLAGYAESGASNVGQEILRHPEAKAIIKEAATQATLELGITAKKVIKELASIAFASPGDVIKVGEDGEADIDNNKLNATEVSVTTTSAGGKKAKIASYKTIKNSDKLAALNLLMKHMGLHTEKVEVEHKGSLLDLIEQSMEEKKPLDIPEENG